MIAAPVVRSRRPRPVVFRNLLFRLHLILGVALSAVLLVSASTGAMLAIRPAMLDRAEAGARRIDSPVDVPRLPAAEWVRRVEAASGAKVTALVVPADPGEAPALSVGKKETWFANPVTGEVRRSPAAGLRTFFDTMLTWHRWLGAPAPERGRDGDAPRGVSLRDIASSVVGVAAGGLALLTVSGLVLWWPRSRTGEAWRFALLPMLGRALVPTAGNWHRAFGFWAAAPILLVSLTGAALAFPSLVAPLGPRPDARAFAALDSPAPPGTRTADADALLAPLRARFPRASRITQNFAGAGRDGARAVTATVERFPGESPALAVALHPVSAAILRERDPDALRPGERFRLMIRPLHEGRWAGPLGMVFSSVAAVSTLILIVTGLVLAGRRLRRALAK